MHGHVLVPLLEPVVLLHVVQVITPEKKHFLTRLQISGQDQPDQQRCKSGSPFITFLDPNPQEKKLKIKLKLIFYYNLKTN